MTDMLPNWTNKSVLALGEADPIEAVIAKARDLAMEAVDSGWAGPPFDPFKLAELIDISVVPRADLGDARSFVSELGAKRIEFNPLKPASRIRFSIAHEIAHTMFPDFAERPRNRMTTDGLDSDDWQLEILCNLAAAELLMPATLFEGTDKPPASMRHLLQQRAKFEVSMETVLLRLTRLTKADIAVFAAHRLTDNEPFYQIDYFVPSSAWTGPKLIADIPDSSVVSSCTAVGHTAELTESWDRNFEVKVSCVGLPPYPGHKFPRVAGFLNRTSLEDESSLFNVVVGDALEPMTTHGEKWILQIVNDKATRWGAGFAQAAARKWPDAQASFDDWSRKPGNLALGAIHTVKVEPGLTLVSMVAQHGYGRSASPRIRYRALTDCLRQIAEQSRLSAPSVHMPMIGTGLSGGNWWVIQELVEDLLCSRGLDVTVYELPQRKAKDPTGQLALPYIGAIHKPIPELSTELTDPSWRNAYF